MTVREVLAKLALADPEAEVLFLDLYAGPDEADVVRLVDIRQESWTHERGTYCSSEPYEAWYPGKPAERNSDYTDIVTTTVHVAVLSAGPTNLRYLQKEGRA